MSSALRSESYEFLKSLLTTASPSGSEAKVQRVWSDYVAPYADRVESDTYGNVFASRSPDAKPHIVLAGHADEIGLMISYINEQGFLYFKAIGGVDRSMLKGQRVLISGQDGPVNGVIGALAIHLQEPDDRKKVPEFHDLCIDIGAADRTEAGRLVRVGDSATVVSEVWELENGRICSRGCDNRIGIWAVAEAMRLLHDHRGSTSARVTAVSTVQEENGLYGATMVGYRLRPSVALVVDVTHATDVPQCSTTKHGEVKLGKGPVISFGSSNHPVVCEKLLHVARARKIPHQIEAAPRSTSTDADAFFLQRGGIPSVYIGLPNRYMHSPVEVIDLADLDALSRLLAAFAESVESGDSFRVAI